jgi:hypothetical protein
MNRAHGMRPISATMLSIAALLVSIISTPGASAQVPQWVIKPFGTYCLTFSAQPTAGHCLADAVYYDSSTMEAYRCSARSQGQASGIPMNIRVDSLVCSRLKLPSFTPGAYSVEFGLAPASGDWQQQKLPTGQTGFSWNNSYWIASADKKDVKFCVNFGGHNQNPSEVCSGPVKWQ